MTRESLCLFLLAIAAASPAEATARMHHARVQVEAVGPYPPFPSGIVAAFIGIIAVDKRQMRRTYYLHFLDDNQPVPAVGAKCTVAYRLMDIQGWVGPTTVRVTRARVILNFAC